MTTESEVETTSEGVDATHRSLDDNVLYTWENGSEYQYILAERSLRENPYDSDLELARYSPAPVKAFAKVRAELAAAGHIPYVTVSRSCRIFGQSQLVFDRDKRRLFMQYASEDQLRDSLAEWAWLAGWEVDTERHLPRWGRLDLAVACPAVSVVAEIKTELERPSAIRRAFQQTDGYRKVLPANVHVWLVAATVGPAAYEYENQYPQVSLKTAQSFLDWLRGCKGDLAWRHKRAVLRRNELADAAHRATTMLGYLAEFGASPLTPRVSPSDP